jgi:hypothetical protein
MSSSGVLPLLSFILVSTPEVPEGYMQPEACRHQAPRLQKASAPSTVSSHTDMLDLLRPDANSCPTKTAARSLEWSLLKPLTETLLSFKRSHGRLLRRRLQTRRPIAQSTHDAPEEATSVIPKVREARGREAGCDPTLGQSVELHLQ